MGRKENAERRTNRSKAEELNKRLKKVQKEDSSDESSDDEPEPPKKPKKKAPIIKSFTSSMSRHRGGKKESQEEYLRIIQSQSVT